ncbi:hypothetical protein CLOM_g3367 [Closterium sp. NIES-68]|nr:hypothetical protein CLOM_g3367 [Closterium sp. NIES-68]GJP78174.1 hypothetical protein CLOP_g8505 [Closterium sp. NIES-67]
MASSATQRATPYSATGVSDGNRQSQAIEIDAQQSQKASATSHEQQSQAQQRRRFKGRKRSWQENAIYLLLGGVVLYLGDGSVHFLDVLFRDPRIRWRPLQAAAACVAVNVAIYLYAAVFLRLLRKDTRSYHQSAPAALAVATAVGLAAYVLCSIAFWPVWGILTLPILWVLFMVFAIITSYLPPFKVRQD